MLRGVRTCSGVKLFEAGAGAADGEEAAAERTGLPAVLDDALPCARTHARAEASVNQAER